MKRNLLFIDDDTTFRRILSRELEGLGYETRACADSESGLEAVKTFQPDVALVDLRLPGMDGIELLGVLLGRIPDLPVVMLTGHGSVREAVDAIRRGAYDFLEKPVGLDLLEQTLGRAVKHGDLVSENRRLRELVERESGATEIFGNSPVMVEMRKLVSRVAMSDATVLVSGENGTGKELVARAIHRASERAARPVVVVNCGAIPGGLVASELFGHEMGSFTGAHKKRLGLIEAAHGGTLFLDEIGEFPLEVQPQLLRALQFGELRPVGSEQTKKVDVRFIAATNLDLLQEVEEGRFREDLYYRLTPLIVDVPPLRERPGDVILLAQLFLARHNQSRPASEQIVLDKDAADRIARHDWPGNVRELENTITRLTTLVGGSTIRGADVERHAFRRSRPSKTALPTLDIESLEAMAIAQALKQHSANRQRAAAELGIAVKTLYNKMQRYGISGRPEDE